MMSGSGEESILEEGEDGEERGEIEQPGWPVKATCSEPDTDQSFLPT
jgi:hypothetical protein